jgi:hypothetical protein
MIEAAEGSREDGRKGLSPLCQFCWDETVVAESRPPKSGMSALGCVTHWRPERVGHDVEPCGDEGVHESPRTRPVSGGPAPQKGAAERRGHPWPPWTARSGGQPPAGPCAPLHELPPTGSTCGRAKGREQSPATSCRGALPPMKRLQGWGRPPDKARVRREAGQAFAQPGRRAILGGLGAPPLIQRAP